MARPITVTLIDDYEIVVTGVAHLFDSYKDRIKVVELAVNAPLKDSVDIALYDSFAQPTAADKDIAKLLHNPKIGAVVVYSWNFHPEQIRLALEEGAAGYISKALTAKELVEALEDVCAGEKVVSPAPESDCLSIGLRWPGRVEGLSERESEVLALITQGKSNEEIASLLFLSINTIKTYIRSVYKKIEATNRVEAVLWGIEHGFKPDSRRIDQWVQGH